MMFMATSGVAADNYTPVSGDDDALHITKYLVVDADTEIPAATFTFAVSEGAAVEATATTTKVWAGLNPSAVKVNDVAGSGTVTFTAGEAAAAGTGAAPDNVATTKKFATKDIELDFSAINFPEPGVYRYILTESGNNHASITNDPVATRTVDVYVEDNNGTLEVSKYVCYSGTVTAGPATAGTDAGTKSDRYVNELSTFDLTVSKTVTGNAGSRDQYFAITVEIANAGAGTVMTLSKNDSMEAATHANSATSYTEETMNAANNVDDDAQKDNQQIIADASGAVSKTFYIHSGQNFSILGLPSGATYRVTEAESGQNGYTTTGEVTTATAIAADTTVAITNNRTTVLPTGLATSISTGVVLMAAAGLGIFALSKKKKEDK